MRPSLTIRSSGRTNNMTLRLVEPQLDFRDSYRTFVQEFKETGEPLHPFTLSFPYDDFDSLVVRLHAYGRGEDLPPGFVAHSTYWLIQNESEIVGVSNLRHELTDKLRFKGGHIGYGIRPSARRKGFATALLAQTLIRAREIGLREVLLTCDKRNEASARTILRNGGILLNEELIPSRGEAIQRYVIPLTD